MIRVVLLDIDGVLTDGKVTVDSNGKEYKTLDFRDIDAVYTLRGAGIKVGLVTGEDTPIAKYFKNRFKPDYFYSGCKAVNDSTYVFTVAFAEQCNCNTVTECIFHLYHPFSIIFLFILNQVINCFKISLKPKSCNCLFSNHTNKTMLSKTFS